MPRAEASLVVDASLAEAWNHYFQPPGWPAWVDQFHAVEEINAYPLAGGTLRWRSTPAGRGTVAEQVLEHEPRRCHRVAWEDPQARGELATEFAIEPGSGGGTRITQRLDYRLHRGGPFAWLTDRLFVRGQMRGSLERSLERFKHEVEEIAGG